MTWFDLSIWVAGTDLMHVLSWITGSKNLGLQIMRASTKLQVR